VIDCNVLTDVKLKQTNKATQAGYRYIKDDFFTEEGAKIPKLTAY
jgi:hypothetical protein